MQNLKEILGDRGVVIISDRNSSLIKAVDEVFGGNVNSWCLRHLSENFKQWLGTELRYRKANKDTAVQLLDGIAYARTLTNFESAMNAMRLFNPRCRDWVIENGPSHWSNALFPFKRWEVMYNNSAESYNNWVKIYRHGSITQFILGQYKLLCDKLRRVGAETSSWVNGVGPRTEAKIAESVYWDLETKYPCEAVVPDKKYNVGRPGRSFAVDLELGTCSCMKWTHIGIPCSHVARVLHHCNGDIYKYLSPAFKAEVQDTIYSHNMAPFPTIDMPRSDTILDGLRPPETKRPPGRPKRNRYESRSKNTRTVYCGRCKLPGHNKRRCINPLYDY